MTDTKSDHSSSSALLLELFMGLLLLLMADAVVVLFACGKIVSRRANSSALMPGSGQAMDDTAFADGAGFGCEATCGTRIEELANGGALLVDVNGVRESTARTSLECVLESEYLSMPMLLANETRCKISGAVDFGVMSVLSYTNVCPVGMMSGMADTCEM